MARSRGSTRGRRLPKALPRDVWERIIEIAGEGRRERHLAVRDRAIVGMAFASGLRSAELVGLDVEDVDLARGIALVRHGKGDKERVPAVAGFGLDPVEAYLDERPELEIEESDGPHRPLFVSRKRTLPGRMDTSAVRRLVQRIEDRLREEGVDLKVHAHAFRHSHITQIVAQAESKGKSIFEVAEQAGHADLDTTRLYYAANAENRKKLVADL